MYHKRGKMDGQVSPKGASSPSPYIKPEDFYGKSELEVALEKAKNMCKTCGMIKTLHGTRFLKCKEFVKII